MALSCRWRSRPQHHKRTHPPFETGASTKNSETVVSHLSGDWNFSEISIADQCPREMVVPKGRVEISLFQRPALYHAVSTVHLVPNIFWRSSHRAAPPAEIKRAAGNIACCPRLSRCWRRGGTKFVGYHPELGIVFEQRIPSDSVNAAAHQFDLKSVDCSRVSEPSSMWTILSANPNSRGS